MADGDHPYTDFDRRMDELKLAVGTNLLHIADKLHEATHVIERYDEKHQEGASPLWPAHLVTLSLALGALAFSALVGIAYPWFLLFLVTLLLVVIVLMAIRYHRTKFQREARRHLDHDYIRRMELELGLRKEDEQDRNEALRLLPALGTFRRGYQPTKTVDTTNPPRGGSAIIGGVRPTQRPDVIIPPSGGSGTKKRPPGTT